MHNKRTAILQIPFAFQWNIPENRLISLKDSENGCVYSALVSNISGFQYGLEIFPNGNNDKHRGETWIFLHLKLGNVKKVKADYTVKIESANFIDEFIYTYDEKSSNYGTDVARIFTLANEKDAEEQQKWEGRELGDLLWKNDDYKDCTIVVGEKEIKVHKSVLRSRSKVFKAMFKPETKKSIENKIEIVDFPFDNVEAGIKLIYQCTFVTTLSIYDMTNLLQFFDKSQIQSLKKEVESRLLPKISAAYVCHLANSSFLTNSTKLKDACMKYLETAITLKTALYDFDILEPDILYEVVKNQRYEINQEEKTEKRKISSDKCKMDILFSFG
uniref:BTB domain-containing protein n=1 Tax=Panagrolaimus sp. PS1159 TaxID=55785 RepID=A0AC35G4J2_9BILA